MIHPTAITENHEAQLQFDQLFGLFSYGIVGTDGTTVQAGSGDWFAIRNSTGNYTIMFQQPRANPPVVVVSVGTAVTSTVSSTVSSFTAVFGAPTNVQFMFWAAG